ncbi:MAG: transglycosylase SLT domain-containing protein, partial [Deltaproteobacteria bacterium]|nr:transglycosylase SLT domain-containing protein [Deltaproteobacteria bacterium]
MAFLAGLGLALSAQPSQGQIQSLSFAGEPVPLNRTDVHESVDQELLLLSEAKARVWLTLRRSTRYLPLIERALSAAKVPPDFKYLSMALTNLDPQFRAGNRRGMWRLSDAEAASMGLRVDKALDERLDPVASTSAAAAKLAALKDSYGSWSLALGAFLDQGALSTALSEAEGERDIYKLYLSESLDRTLSQVLAGKLLYANPERYGYSQSRGWPPLGSKRAQVEGASSVRALASRYKLDYKTFRTLNPHILGDTAPSGAWLNV